MNIIWKFKKLDMFANFYNVLGHSQITEVFSKNIILENSITVAKFKFQL